MTLGNIRKTLSLDHSDAPSQTTNGVIEAINDNLHSFLTAADEEGRTFAVPEKKTVKSISVLQKKIIHIKSIFHTSVS